MTPEEVSELETGFGIKFPPDYRNAVTDAYPFKDATMELDSDAASLREFNEAFREEDPYEFPWKEHYWWIGGDGAGGFYFIDVHQNDSTVYYCDHEDMPKSIDDLDHISVTPFQDFVSDIQDLEKEYEEWDEVMQKRVANRKWWQIWIPRKWPPAAGGRGGGSAKNPE